MSILSRTGQRLRLAAITAFAAFAALTSALTAGPAPLAIGLAIGTAAFAPSQADAATSYNVTTRTGRAQSIVTALGSGAKMKFYNGTRPSGTGALSGNTLCATLTWSGAPGTVTNGVITYETTVSQTASSHVNCTPTFIDFTTSGDTVVQRTDVGTGSGNIQVAAPIANGQNITITGMTWTEANQ